MRLLSILVALATLPAAAAAAAQESPQPGYSDYNDFRLELESIAASEFADLGSLGRTLSKRDVYLLTVGKGNVDDKPAVLILGGLDASGISGSEVATRLAKRLVREAGEKPALRDLLDRVTFYFIPRAAPDACEAFFRRPFHARIRNDRPMDEDADGRIDEDGPNDLNGDGWITRMRVLDPAGEYVCDPDDPRIMIKFDPKKSPKKTPERRYRLLTEGVDDDKDTKINEDPPGGTAFNRNFAFDYPFFGEGAGPHQISEPETRAVADFAFAHKNIFLVWVFSEDENLSTLWKTDAAAEKKKIKTTLQESDLPDYRALAETYKESATRKDPPSGSAQKGGTIGKWSYFHFGRPTVITRPWWPTIDKAAAAEKDEPKEKKDGGKTAEKKEAGKEKADEDAESEKENEKADGPAEKKKNTADATALEWFAKRKIDGFVPWKEYKHPDFPGRLVEIGGFRPFLRENPPQGELDGATDSAFTFLTKLEGLFSPACRSDGRSKTAR